MNWIAQLSTIDSFLRSIFHWYRKLLNLIPPHMHQSSKHLLFFKTSSSHLDVLKTTSVRLQRNNFSSSKTSSRRLEEVLEDEKLLRWRRTDVVFKTSRWLEDVLKNNKCLLDWCICGGMRFNSLRYQWKILLKKESIVDNWAIQFTQHNSQ